MAEKLPVWRSLLFIPANNEKYVSKAHTRRADAVILDLEDSIAQDQKCKARELLPEAAELIVQNGTDVLVRINSELWLEDINGTCSSYVSAFIVPKVNDPGAIIKIAELLDKLEVEKSLPIGGIKLIAQIEDVRALPNLDDIANCSSRLLGMSLGSEDFSVSANQLPLPETLYGPNQQVAFACRRASIMPFGFPASITVFSDINALETAAKQAANMGMVGAFCIHPNQITALNSAMTPSSEEVENAYAILEGYERSQKDGRGVFAYNGKMVDLPVIFRAREVVARSDAIRKKSK